MTLQQEMLESLEMLTRITARVLVELGYSEEGAGLKVALDRSRKAISRAQAEGEAAPTGPYVVEFNEETQGYNVCERGGGPIVAVINALDYELPQQRAIADLFEAAPTMREALSGIEVILSSGGRPAKVRVAMALELTQNALKQEPQS